MNTLTLLRQPRIKFQILAVARYGKPLNRWKWV